MNSSVQLEIKIVVLSLLEKLPFADAYSGFQNECQTIITLLTLSILLGWGVGIN